MAMNAAYDQLAGPSAATAAAVPGAVRLEPGSAGRANARSAGSDGQDSQRHR